MILYGSQTSPYVRHCRIVLMQSGLPWTFQDTDYAASAAGSPTKRVPYFQDGDTRLTDSSSILMHLRQRLGQPYMEKVEQLERYALCNTLLDTAINLFLLERDGLGPTDSDYLARQQAIDDQEFLGGPRAVLLHGGERFSESVLISADVLQGIRSAPPWECGSSRQSRRATLPGSPGGRY